MTPLRITWGAHSAIAYKRDFGLGGGPVDGLPRVIDLWWQFAGRIGIPYENGLWSGPVRIERPPGRRRRRICSGRRPGRERPSLHPGAPPRRAGSGRVRARDAGGVVADPGSARAAAPGRAGGCAPERARSRSRRSSPPATRSSASRIVYGAAHGLPLSASRPHTTARAASSTCSTAHGCCRSPTARPRASSRASVSPGRAGG